MNPTTVIRSPAFSWGVKQQPDPTTPDTTALLEGNYVTPAGKPNALFLVENGPRRSRPRRRSRSA